MAKKKAKAKRSRRGGRTPGQWVDLTQAAVTKYRKDAKLSRAKLAEQLGVSSTSIQNWETGRAIPLRRYQQQLVELIKGGAAPSAPARGRAAAAATPRTVTSSSRSATPEVEVTRLTVTGEVLKAYLATTQGGKVSQDQLVDLTRALHGALA